MSRTNCKSCNCKVSLQSHDSCSCPDLVSDVLSSHFIFLEALCGFCSSITINFTYLALLSINLLVPEYLSSQVCPCRKFYHPSSKHTRADQTLALMPYLFRGFRDIAKVPAAPVEVKWPFCSQAILARKIFSWKQIWSIWYDTNTDPLHLNCQKVYVALVTFPHRSP